MPTKAGIQATAGEWIPAFAGMTEALCQFVARIKVARVFSKKATKITKVESQKIRLVRS